MASQTDREAALKQGNFLDCGSPFTTARSRLQQKAMQSSTDCVCLWLPFARVTAGANATATPVDAFAAGGAVRPGGSLLCSCLRHGQFMTFCPHSCLAFARSLSMAGR